MAAARASAVRSSASTGVPSPSTAARAAPAAAANPSEMAVGCMPRRSSLAAAARRAPAITVTVVVPSPAAASCALASSTSILAAGWETAMVLRMVAPSLVMMTSPLGWVTWGEWEEGKSSEKGRSSPHLFSALFPLLLSLLPSCPCRAAPGWCAQRRPPPWRPQCWWCGRRACACFRWRRGEDASVSERSGGLSRPPRRGIWGRPPLAALRAIGAASDLVTKTAGERQGVQTAKQTYALATRSLPPTLLSPERLAPQRGGRSGGGGGGSRRGGRHRVGRGVGEK